jgi:hypothetical protein
MAFDEGAIDILDACVVVSAHRMLPVALANIGNE